MKLTKYYNKLLDMAEDLESKVEYLESLRDSIEEKANDKDRDMTEREQERYDFFDEEVYAIQECIEYLYNARDSIEEYSEESW